MVKAHTFFSILMTAYNREQYIAQAIESVLNQSYKYFELIIVDDSSSDNTVKIVHSYAKSDSRIKLHVNKENIGDYPNRNRAASYAQGDIFIYVDSDDTINTDTLSYILECFNKFTLAEFATIYNGNDIRNVTSLSNRVSLRKHFFEKSFLHIGPGGTVIKKSLFDNIGGFPVNYGPAGDMFYNIKAASTSPVICMPYNYLNYRRHEGQEINDSYAYLHNGYRYFNDVLSLAEIPLKESQKDYLKLKNKRRFFINSIKYLLKSRNLRKFKAAYTLAEFTIKDIFKAIFQW